MYHRKNGGVNTNKPFHISVEICTTGAKDAVTVSLLLQKLWLTRKIQIEYENSIALTDTGGDIPVRTVLLSAVIQLR
jgi:hypothetical protein